VITIENISKSYQDINTLVLDDLSLSIYKGEFLIILGRSGCGKSTLLHMLNRMILPSAGRILIDNTDITHMDPILLRRNMGYVFQKPTLFPHLNVLQNITLIPHMQGKSLRNRRERASEVLSWIELNPKHYLSRYPEELSGGEQQRVSIARALVNNPKMLLMDEPFSALDVITRERLQDLLLQLKSTYNQTIVFVTHDIQEAIKLGDRIAILHDGRLAQVGTHAQIIEKPASDFVKQLFRNVQIH